MNTTYNFEREDTQPHALDEFEDETTAVDAPIPMEMLVHGASDGVPTHVRPERARQLVLAVGTLVPRPRKP